MQVKKHVLVAAVLSALVSSAFAQAREEGPWMVRARAIHLDSANKDSTGLNLTINDKWMPEVDVTYFVNPNVAVELVLTVPQKHTVSAGATSIGTLKHLPPTLLAQYHFLPKGSFRPYVGAGINYTRFSSVNLPAGVDIDRNSFGLALQAGVDIPVGKNVYLNFDIKKVHIKTDISVAGTTIGTFKVNPLLLGVGVGYRF